MKILKIGILLLLPCFTFGGIFTIDFGGHYDFLNNGEKWHSTTTLPSYGFTFGGKIPGWHFRFKINGSGRNFDIALPTDGHFESSTTIRGVLGFQWVFEKWLGVHPFLVAGLQLKHSEVKFLRDSLILYNYYQFKRVSIPLTAGFFVLLPASIALSFEVEADFIPLSSFQKLVEGSAIVGGDGWYNEFGLACYLGLGLYY